MSKTAMHLLGLLALFASTAQAQDIRYITDTLYVPVRSGQGSEYRIVHRGIPSGTRVTVEETNEDSGYSHIITDGGTEGWILSRYLEDEVPATDRLRALEERYNALIGDENSVRSQLVEAQDSSATLTEKLNLAQAELEQATTELTAVRRVSSNALALDESNRRLTEQVQVMQTRIEVLEADNRRLQDSHESDAFINGALAVLLGVIIALLVPRLRPKPRSSSSWV